MADEEAEDSNNKVLGNKVVDIFGKPIEIDEDGVAEVASKENDKSEEVAEQLKNDLLKSLSAVAKEVKKGNLLNGVFLGKNKNGETIDFIHCKAVEVPDFYVMMETRQDMLKDLVIEMEVCADVEECDLSEDSPDS